MAYSDAFRTEALVRLAINKYDFDKTAKQVGVTKKTLIAWERKYTKKSVPELLDRAIERMLMVIPDNWKGNDWAIALGILIDKWLLMQGQPTERTENIFTQLQKLPDDELDELIHQFQQAAVNGSSPSKS